MKSSFQAVMLLLLLSVITAPTAGAPLGEETASRARPVAGKESAESTAAEPDDGGDDRPQKSPARTTIPEENLRIPEEMQACAAGLRKIYAAIQEYKKDAGKLPDWLSDLVSDYLDQEALLCPTSQRPKTSMWADPKLPCSFTYEFSPTRLLGNWGPATGMTCREWKTSQVKFLGDVVPLVRCRHESRALSLSVGGQVYWSPVVWESLFVPNYSRGGAMAPEDRAFDYTVPAGGVDPLLEFITDLKEFRPRTPYQTAEHSRRAPAALKAAASRILRLEKDEWSEAYQTALRILLEDRIRLLSRADPVQQKQIAGFITTFLTAKAEKTIQPEDVRLATSAGHALEEAGNLRFAAEIYGRAAELVAREDDEKLSGLLRLLQGASRRLALEGKETTVEGTQMDGTTLNWAAYRGKVVLVQFWASESDVWRAELPGVKLNYELYHDRGFEVIGVSTDRDRRALEEFLAREPLPWVVLHEEDPEAQNAMVVHYGVTGVPTALMVGQEGKVVSIRTRGGELDRLLEELLGPPYVPKGKLTCIDLQPKANRKLEEGRRGFPENNLGELPKGEQTMGGVRFRIGDALIQLAGTRLAYRPEKVEGIEVTTTLARLYILHGTAWGTTVPDGTLIGQYKVHYSDGTEETIPIVNGADVRDWWHKAGAGPVSRGRIAWEGNNAATRRANTTLRLYVGAWKNPHPDKNVEKIDYVSTNATEAAPFCVAMTVEEVADTSTNKAASDPGSL